MTFVVCLTIYLTALSQLKTYVFI